MKRVAILSDSFPPNPCGGIATSQYNLQRCLLESGYNVRVFTYLDKETKNKEIGISRNGLTKFNRIVIYIENFIRNKVEKLFISNHKEKGISYQTHIIKQALIGAKKINRQLDDFKPEIVLIPDFGAPISVLIKPSNSKFIYISHHNPIRFINNPLLPLHSTLDAEKAISYEKKALWKIDSIICPSNYMKCIFNETFHPEQNISVIPNIVNEKFIQSVIKTDIHAQLNIPANFPIVYIPSANSKIKGEQFVIEIIRRINKAMDNKVGFYLSGGISENQKYELSILDVKNVFSSGNIDYKTNISFIKDCNLCVSPTLLESFGMALLEAAFCDIPSVSFNVGGNQDFIVNGENGFLVPYLDIETLISKSVEILRSETIYNKLKENIKVLKHNYSSENIFRKYLHLIN